MNQENVRNYDDTGYLKTRVYTALGAIPLAGVSVKISSLDEDAPTVALDLITDRNGETETVSLPAPPRALANTPGNARPYALYRIEAYLEHYGAYSALNVPVFGGILSVQPIGLVPSGSRAPTPENSNVSDSDPAELEPLGE